MKKSIALLLSALVALASCTEKDLYDPSYTQKQYQQNWTKKFGKTDPNQDWNMASSCSVTVTAGESGRIKVYAPSGKDNVFELVADYSNLSGTQEIRFSAPKGTKDVFVTDGTNSQMVKVGQSISFAQTRGVVTSDNAETGVKIEEGEGKGVANTSYFLQTIPENGNNLAKPEIATDFFYYTTENSFTIYPIYSNTGAQLTLGIYYYIDGVKYEQDIYEFPQTYHYIQNNLPNGIHVTMPSSGIKMGMYVKQEVKGTTHQFYSESALNACGHNHAATFKSNNVTYIGFEDWDNPVFDLNDLVCYITPDPIIVAETPLTWTLACEDLGSTDDYDFNDIVFSATFVSGTNEISITPLAAGGTIPAYIWFNNEKIGEIHELLGAESTSQMVNTTTYDGPGATITRPIPANYSFTPNMEGFRLTVGADEAKMIKAPEAGTAPQMICVPSSWLWPTERASITEAYPMFATWNSNANSLEWVSNVAPEKVVRR